MRRSASLFRQRWGQQVTGNVVIGGIAGLVVAVGAAVFAGTTRGVFGVALDRYVADDQTLGPFTAPELDSAARTR